MKNQQSSILSYIAFSIFSFFAIQNLYCQNSTTAGIIEVYQTINSIGIEWPIIGDENHNTVCLVKYQKTGNSEWQNALPLYRIDYNTSNMMAGSILFLEPSTSYQIELSLNDSDGGSSNQTFEVITRGIPQMPVGGNTYYVAPGDGGGNGKSNDPFLGIETAQSIAQPGDIFLLKSGTYESDEDNGKIQFSNSGTADNYIVWKADDGASVVLGGARIKCDFIWLEGIAIQNQQHGVLVGSNVPEGIVITKNNFKGCHYSINLNHGGKNWYITDNVIEGDIPDFTTGELGGEGIELQHSNGHIVAHNKIFNTADGVSYPGKNCDIFRNEIYNVSDDGIEFDFGFANNRAWENRITSANNNGISFQPMNGAPMYVIRNQVIVIGQDAIKLRDGVDRALIANNTFVCWRGVMSLRVDKLSSFQSNNNLWISVTDRYVWEDNSDLTTTDWRTSLDYDGFDWNNNSLAFKWKNERYATLEAFQAASGLQEHGIRVRKDEIFETYDFPESPSPTPLQYLTIKENCNAIDAGIALNNINDRYNGSAPDLGAFEFGRELPVYGPRGVNEATGIGTVRMINSSLELNQNYPNPFSTNTTIEYSISDSHYSEYNIELVTLKVYDLLGTEMAVLVNKKQSAGNYKVEFNADHLSVGTYIYRLTNGKNTITKKMFNLD